MSKFKCQICGYVHDEIENGDFASLDESYICPICGAPKNLFEEEKEAAEENSVNDVQEKLVDDLTELNNLEISAICSNLARGCEKQYLLSEAESFRKIANYFNKEKIDAKINKTNLMELINDDLSKNLIAANEEAVKHNDRGAQRALTWSTKVTNILKILLEKYYDDDLENTKVYVCTICGFIFVGNTAPDLCPVCKVQKNKFVEVEDN